MQIRKNMRDKMKFDKKKNPETLCLSRFQDFTERCLADSNRRRRFCRPLTKPLIQGTKLAFI